MRGDIWLLALFCKLLQTSVEEGAWSAVQMEIEKMYTGSCRQSVKAFISRILESAFITVSTKRIADGGYYDLKSKRG